MKESYSKIQLVTPLQHYLKTHFFFTIY